MYVCTQSEYKTLLIFVKPSQFYSKNRINFHGIFIITIIFDSIDNISPKNGNHTIDVVKAMN